MQPAKGHTPWRAAPGKPLGYFYFTRDHIKLRIGISPTRIQLTRVVCEYAPYDLFHARGRAARCSALRGLQISPFRPTTLLIPSSFGSNELKWPRTTMTPRVGRSTLHILARLAGNSFALPHYRARKQNNRDDPVPRRWSDHHYCFQFQCERSWPFSLRP